MSFWSIVGEVVLFGWVRRLFGRRAGGGEPQPEVWRDAVYDAREAELTREIEARRQELVEFRRRMAANGVPLGREYEADEVEDDYVDDYADDYGYDDYGGGDIYEADDFAEDDDW